MEENFADLGRVLGSGGAGRGRKLIGRDLVNLIVGWCGRFFIFCCPFSIFTRHRQVARNQILIPDWTYFDCLRADPRSTRFEEGFLHVLKILFTCASPTGCLFLLGLSRRARLRRWEQGLKSHHSPGWQSHCCHLPGWQSHHQPKQTLHQCSQSLNLKGGSWL